jgi:hypothetical protein
MQVAIGSKALDLFSPKFGLDDLGLPGEKILLKATLSTGGKVSVIFGTYKIGSRHAQISANILTDFGGSVQVTSVVRYSLSDLIRDVNPIFQRDYPKLNLVDVGRDETLRVGLEAKFFSAKVARLYTVGGRVYLVLQVLGKNIRIEFFEEGVRIFDSSRRELTGLTIAGNRLLLRRRFQHPELSG